VSDQKDGTVTLIRASILAISVATTLSPASAQTLFEKISKSTEKGMKAVEGTVQKAGESVGDSIDSTIALTSDEETPELTRARMDAMSDEVLTRLFIDNPDANELFDLAAGYAVFDARRSTLLLVSAGFGRGVAVSKIADQRTYMTMGTGGVGLSLGLGGFERQIVILFEDEPGFNSFVVNGYDATAEAGTMFGDDKTDETARYVDGRSIFVLTRKGWKVSASAAGTKYWADPKLN